jgi:hypothetical protein
MKNDCDSSSVAFFAPTMRVLTLINALLCAGIAIGSALEGWNEWIFVSYGLISGGFMVLAFWTRARPAI